MQNQAYVAKFLDFPPGYFDVAIVDGLMRSNCFQAAILRLATNGILVVDNSDNDRTADGEMFIIDEMLHSLDSELQVHRFHGWEGGNFHCWETTVCVQK